MTNNKIIHHKEYEISLSEIPPGGANISLDKIYEMLSASDVKVDSAKIGQDYIYVTLLSEDISNFPTHEQVRDWVFLPL